MDYLADFILLVSEDTQFLKDVSKDFETHGIPVLMSNSERNALAMLSRTYEGLYPCSKCPLKFKTMVSLSEHKCTSRHLRFLTCLNAHCQMVGVLSPDELEEHQRLVHGIGAFICFQCGKDCGNQSTLNLHVESHERKNELERNAAKFSILKERNMELRLRDFEYLVVAQRDTWLAQQLEGSDIQNIVIVLAGEEDGESSVSCPLTEVGVALLRSKLKRFAPSETLVSPFIGDSV